MGDRMGDSINRREFITTSAGIAAVLGIAPSTARAQAPARGAQAAPPPSSSLTFKTRPHKALIARPTEDELKRMKDAGFEGVEARVMPRTADRVLHHEAFTKRPTVMRAGGTDRKNLLPATGKKNGLVAHMAHQYGAIRELILRDTTR